MGLEMRVTDVGGTDPDIAVVCGIHGDEPAGVRAAQRLVDEKRFQRPVRFVVANEKALDQRERFVDADLNRSFPGDARARAHELELAPKLLEAIGDRAVIDLHTTMSRPTPFLILGTIVDPSARRLAQASGLENAVHHEHLGGGLLDHVPGVALEGGPMGTDTAEEQLYQATSNVLAGVGTIDGATRNVDPNVYRVYESIHPPSEDAFTKLRNFTLVDEGDTVAENRTRCYESQDTFVPVLVSNDGYRDILGFKATDEGTLSEYANPSQARPPPRSNEPRPDA
jgi:succinylglutamate desuccinylase